MSTASERPDVEPPSVLLTELDDVENALIQVIGESEPPGWELLRILGALPLLVVGGSWLMAAPWRRWWRCCRTTAQLIKGHRRLRRQLPAGVGG